MRERLLARIADPDTRREVAAHLDESVAARVELGATPEQAEAAAVLALGPVDGRGAVAPVAAALALVTGMAFALVAFGSPVGLAAGVPALVALARAVSRRREGGRSAMLAIPPLFGAVWALTVLTHGVWAGWAMPMDRIEGIRSLYGGLLEGKRRSVENFDALRAGDGSRGPVVVRRGDPAVVEWRELPAAERRAAFDRAAREWRPGAVRQVERWEGVVREVDASLATPLPARLLPAVVATAPPFLVGASAVGIGIALGALGGADRRRRRRA